VIQPESIGGVVQNWVGGYCSHPGVPEMAGPPDHLLAYTLSISPDSQAAEQKKRPTSKGRFHY